LAHRALSGSAAPPADRHIVDPRTGRPVSGRLAAWAITRTATRADALSTAFMVMRQEEIQAYSEAHPDVMACIAAGDARRWTLTWFGRGGSGAEPKDDPRKGEER
jgi:hypothetical protein